MTTHALRPPPADAPAWVHRAWKLIDEQDHSVYAAAKAVGKHHSSLRYWVVDGEADRITTKAQGWAADNRERYNALARASVDRQRARDPEGFRERRRASQRRHRRDRANRGTCTECGGAMGIDNPDDGTCAQCRADATHARYQQIERMWKAGDTQKTIAAAVGLSVPSLQGAMHQMRRDDRYDLPYRQGYPR